MISNWLSAFGAPCIVAAGQDSRFIGKAFQECRTTRHIVAQTVIPGHHQSLGATERSHGLLRSIIAHVVGNKNPNSSIRKEWKGFASMATMRLNTQVRKFGGFAPGHRVFGRTPEMPICTTDNPHFEDFTNPKDAPTSKNQWLIGVIRKIRHAPPNADFSNKLNTTLNRRVRGAKSEEFFFWEAVFF